MSFFSHSPLYNLTFFWSFPLLNILDSYIFVRPRAYVYLIYTTFCKLILFQTFFPQVFITKVDHNLQNQLCKELKQVSETIRSLIR